MKEIERRLQALEQRSNGAGVNPPRRDVGLSWFHPTQFEAGWLLMTAEAELRRRGRPGEVLSLYNWGDVQFTDADFDEGLTICDEDGVDLNLDAVRSHFMQDERTCGHDVFARTFTDERN